MHDWFHTERVCEKMGVCSCLFECFSLSVFLWSRGGSSVCAERGEREKERSSVAERARVRDKERESELGEGGGEIKKDTLVDVHSMLMPSSIGGGGFTPDGQTQRK